jgi:hypothetical protein
VHVQHGPRLQRCRKRVLQRNDAGDVRERCAKLRIRIRKHDVHQRCVQRRRVLHQQLYARANHMRLQQPRHMRAGRQRLLGLRHTRGLRDPPELHGYGGGGCVHLQRRFCVQNRGNDVRELGDPGDVLDRRAGLRIRVSCVALYQWRMQRRSMLQQRMHAGSNVVRQWPAGHLHARRQRLHGLRHASALRTPPELHGAGGGGRLHVRHRPCLQLCREHLCGPSDACDVLKGCANNLRLRIGERDVQSHNSVLPGGRVQQSAELRSGRPGDDQLRTQRYRELLHDLGSDGRHVFPDVHELGRRPDGSGRSSVRE